MSSTLETLIIALLNGENVDFNPISRSDKYLKNCLEGLGAEGLPAPISRLDNLLYQLAIKTEGGADITAPDGYGVVIYDENSSTLIIK